MKYIDRVSQVIMFLSVFGLISAITEGYVFSSIIAVVLISQYPALQLYRGFKTTDSDGQTPGDQT